MSRLSMLSSHETDSPVGSAKESRGLRFFLLAGLGTHVIQSRDRSNPSARRTVRCLVLSLRVSEPLSFLELGKAAIIANKNPGAGGRGSSATPP